MGENPETEIFAEPQWDLFYFGDGYVALSLGGTVNEDIDGKMVVNLIIKPSPLLRKRYGITDSMLNQNLCMPYKVYESDLIPWSMFDPANRKWIYLKNFRHEDTEITNWEWRLRKENVMFKERIQMLEGENMWLLEQLNLAKTNPAEFIAQSLEVTEKIGAKWAEAMRGEKEGKGEGWQQ